MFLFAEIFNGGSATLNIGGGKTMKIISNDCHSKQSNSSSLQLLACQKGKKIGYQRRPCFWVWNKREQISLLCWMFFLLRSSMVEVHSLNIGGGKIMKTMTNDVCCSPSLSTMHFYDIWVWLRVEYCVVLWLCISSKLENSSLASLYLECYYTFGV